MKEIRSTGIRILLIGVIATVAVALTGVGTALAAPPAPVTHAVASTPIIDAAGRLVVPDMPAPGTTIILSETATKRIFAAILSGGVPAGVLVCQALAPSGFKEWCSAIVGALASAATTRKDGTCIKITVRLGRPPIKVSLVPCPPGPGDENHTSYEPNLGRGGALSPNTAAPSPRGGIIVGAGGPGVLVP